MAEYDRSPEHRQVQAVGLAALAIMELPELIVVGAEALGGAAVSRVPRALEKGCGCFVAGTLVETDHGLRPIEQIKVGDLVRSRNETSGKLAFEPVTGLIRPHDRRIYEVRLAQAGSGSIETFEVTDDHPWMSKDGEWLTTLQLAAGGQIQTEDGKGVKVISIAATSRVADTYNLEVAGFHTYFVGKQHVWVHNSCFGFWGGSSFKSATESVLYHFGKHGAAVGATSAGQYARMAIGFAQANAAGIAGAAVRADGTQKFVAGANFIIMRGAEIVSFGLK